MAAPLPFTHCGGRPVNTYRDTLFRKLRDIDGVPGDVLKSAESFDFSKLAAGGGKGGDPLGFSAPDRRFIVKELNKGDHESLTDLTQSYIEHVTDRKGSLLCRFYAHFAVDGKNYVMMNNVLPPSGEYKAQYDLKGCADDKTLLRDGVRVREVHKRIYNVSMWMGKAAWSPERHHYHENKLRARSDLFHVTAQQHADLSRMLERDTAFLARFGLMDYSLIVGIQQKKATDALRLQITGVQHGLSGCPREQPAASVFGGMVDLHFVGIIDFLQDWNVKKMVARKIKVLERNKATVPPGMYAKRFFTTFRDKFVGDAQPCKKLLLGMLASQHSMDLGKLDEESKGGGGGGGGDPATSGAAGDVVEAAQNEARRHLEGAFSGVAGGAGGAAGGAAGDASGAHAGYRAVNGNFAGNGRGHRIGNGGGGGGGGGSSSASGRGGANGASSNGGSSGSESNKSGSSSGGGGGGGGDGAAISWSKLMVVALVFTVFWAVLLVGAGLIVESSIESRIDGEIAERLKASGIEVPELPAGGGGGGGGAAAAAQRAAGKPAKKPAKDGAKGSKAATKGAKKKNQPEKKKKKKKKASSWGWGSSEEEDETGEL